MIVGLLPTIVGLLPAITEFAFVCVVLVLQPIVVMGRRRRVMQDGSSKRSNKEASSSNASSGAPGPGGYCFDLLSDAESDKVSTAAASVNSKLFLLCLVTRCSSVCRCGQSWKGCWLRTRAISQTCTSKRHHHHSNRRRRRRCHRRRALLRHGSQSRTAAAGPLITLQPLPSVVTTEREGFPPSSPAAVTTVVAVAVVVTVDRTGSRDTNAPALTRSTTAAAVTSE